jgi:hypothetical protein
MGNAGLKRSPKHDVGVGRGLLLFLGFYLSGFAFLALVERLSSQPFQVPLLESGLYDALFVSIAYLFNKGLLCTEWWKVRPNWWIGIVLGITIQVPISYAFRALPRPTSVAVIVGTVLVAPFFEELIRAVMIAPLMERWGHVWAIAIAAPLWACIHEHFWIALIQQSALSAIFVFSRKSLPSVIAAHVVMNLAAVTLW